MRSCRSIGSIATWIPPSTASRHRWTSVAKRARFKKVGPKWQPRLKHVIWSIQGSLKLSSCGYSEFGFTHFGFFFDYFGLKPHASHAAARHNTGFEPLHDGCWKILPKHATAWASRQRVPIWQNMLRYLGHSKVAVPSSVFVEMIQLLLKDFLLMPLPKTTPKSRPPGLLYIIELSQVLAARRIEASSTWNRYVRFKLRRLENGGKSNMVSRCKQ